MKAFLNKFSSFFLQGGLKETVLRFPLSSFCAFALFVLVVLTSHDVIDEKTIGRFVACFAAGYFWFGAVRLMAESRGANFKKEMAVAFLVFVPFAALMGLADDYGLYLLFIIPALLLFLMIAPYTQSLRDSSNDLSFWVYNRILWVGVLVSFLAIFIMTGGLHAAFASIEALFDIDLPHEIMGDIWAFSALLVGPVYALSWVPKEFNFVKEECKDPPGLGFLLNWILAPLILIYFLILYAYLVKLIVVQELPLGVLAYMVTGFAGVGIATYLIGWPMHENGGAILQKVYKYLFPALAIPVVLQFIAIGERIYTYGVTEQRYMIVLSAIWLAVLVGLFTVKKASSIKIIPTLLSLLLFLAAFGPWGAVGLSGMSQQHRLEKLLVKHEILKDGRVTKTEKDISFDDRKSISSKVEYMHDTERKDRLRVWFPDKTDEEWEKLTAYNMVEAMGIKYVSRYETGTSDDRFHYYTRHNQKRLTDVRGYDYASQNIYTHAMGDDQVRSQNKVEADANKNQPEISWRLNKESILSVTVEGRGAVTFDLGEMVRKKREAGHSEEQEEMQLQGFAQGLKIRLIISNMSGAIKNDTVKVDNVSFVMLLDL